jgi:hypothetical protein
MASADPEVAHAKSSIGEFVRFVMRTPSGQPFEVLPHHEAMLNAMVSERFVLIEAWRGSGKSRCVIAYSLWRLMHNRDTRIMIITESDKLAKDWIREIETYMCSPQYIRLAGEMVPQGFREGLIWTNTEKIVRGRSPTAEGLSLLATGLQGQIRGRHVDVALIDDVVSETNSFTQYQRGNVSHQFHAAVLPTLDHNPDEPLSGQCIVTGTPLYDNDLLSELRKEWA